ncbi:T-cell surface glycoprotein CD8 alpha chain isoform X1 [Callorhinchus milii]|uniref:T-cell surface glycoprotein CD8 alpha chain isoform X1 n=1 Tax=Callorhinchus milii TaxID=7868 RepID=UPI00045742D2|nr:T-cell surface glycoprotein CD8 alpha chain isoform X1 [Callorhinchus milii]|eukprot:gi/632960437/ref/XP_007896195.1/ PREDICTED: T-cell surface glycoprotein CD8 beta chain-like isoform X1 [Callorhinchus milii]
MARLVLGFLSLMALPWATYQNTQQVQEGTSVSVPCSLRADDRIYWFRHSKGKNPEFLLYVSPLGRVSPSVDANFEATVTHLKIKKFAKRDTGSYFCLMLQNSKLEFGKVNDFHLPEVTTIATKVSTTKLPPPKTEAPQTSTTQPSRGIADDRFSCHLIIWTSLAGVSSLLLVILVTVSILYCKRPRRRRCQHQFRKRPMPEEDRRLPNNYY